jgi:hypothetical protein
MRAPRKLNNLVVSSSRQKNHLFSILFGTSKRNVKLNVVYLKKRDREGGGIFIIRLFMKFYEVL